MNQPTGDEYRYKYSGGLGTYPQQHVPIAIYSAAANKTFFCYGGADRQAERAAAHGLLLRPRHRQVPRPRSCWSSRPTTPTRTRRCRSTTRATSGSSPTRTARRTLVHLPQRDAVLDRRVRAGRADQLLLQPAVVRARPGLSVSAHALRKRPAAAAWMTSPDGREWSEPQPLAQSRKGHYQISNRHGERVATAFNYHPDRRAQRPDQPLLPRNRRHGHDLANGRGRSRRDAAHRGAERRARPRLRGGRSSSI